MAGNRQSLPQIGDLGVFRFSQNLTKALFFDIKIREKLALKKEEKIMKEEKETLLEQLPEEVRTLLDKTVVDFEKKQELALEARKKILEIVSQHNDSRFELLLKRWEEKDLGWCSKCDSLVKTDQLKLVLIWGKERCSGGYENSCYGFESFEHLLQVCTACQIELLARNKTYGKYDSMAEDQESFFAKEVSVEDCENTFFEKHPPVINHDLEIAWKIPPKIVVSREKLHVSGTAIPHFAEIPGL